MHGGGRDVKPAQAARTSTAAAPAPAPAPFDVAGQGCDTRRMPAVLSVAFFLSGLTALILEVVWGRLLQYVFGASALALSSVLTAYMAGLALGSFLAGRIADRLRRPAM